MKRSSTQPTPSFTSNKSHFRFYLVLSAGQQENSQGCKILIKEFHYVLTCLAKAVCSSLSVGHQWRTKFWERSSDYWRWVMDSTGSSAFVLLMIPSKRFLMMNQRLQPCFWNCFPWLWLMEPWFTSLQCQRTQFMPNILCHHLCSFSGPSSLYWTENWVGNIFIDKLFSGHIPFSFSMQHPLLVCAVLPYQHGSITDTDLTRSHSSQRCTPQKRMCPQRFSFLKPMNFSVT